jgi:hypothetical protein
MGAAPTAVKDEHGFSELFVIQESYQTGSS